MKTKRPAGGFPWEQSGHTFSIGWPPGFEPTTLATGKSPQELSRIAAKSREKQLANGHTGSIRGLSPKADALLVQQRAQRAGLKK